MEQVQEVAMQALVCLANFVCFVAPCLVVLILVRFFTNLPSFVYRKMLHVVAFVCVSVVILVAKSWQAVIASLLFVAAAAYPVLVALESRPWFSRFFAQKSPGEIKRSMLMLLITTACIVAVAWGVFGRRELAAAAILMWGPGDGMAALVGIPWGRHKVQLRLADGKKSWEGSAAMFVTAFACGTGVLTFCGYELSRALLLAAAGAFTGAFVEVITPSEYDTVTVPVAILAVLLVLAAF